MSVFEQVKAILVERLELDPETIKLESSFVELQIDSLDLYEMMYEVENKFGVHIPEDRSIDTVGALVEFIEKTKA